LSTSLTAIVTVEAVSLSFAGDTDAGDTDAGDTDAAAANGFSALHQDVDPVETVAATHNNDTLAAETVR
jgi:hypothetical protein